MQLAMIMAAGICFFIGCWPEYLYRLLPRPVRYGPYTGQHLSETLQILGFTGLGFYLLVKKLAPADRIHLDLDWLYRMAARVLVWCSSGPVARLDQWAGELYRRAGLPATMQTARGLSWFDLQCIDRLIDGFARHVALAGERVRNLQTGKIQQYIGAAVVFLFLLLTAFVLL
jgi:multicomponent Na+:H+ antiporter subunit D